MEMMNDCPETFNNTLNLPKPITGLNIWPPNNPNVTTKDIYDSRNPIGHAEIQYGQHVVPDIEVKHARQVRSNRGPRRGMFSVNPEWISEQVDVQRPMTARAFGKVYEPNSVDFFGARDLHAKTWEQARIAPGHGTNTHQSIPGYAPYKHKSVDYRTAESQIANAWPWNKNLDTTISPGMVVPERRVRSAMAAYYTDFPEPDSRFNRELNALHAVHVNDKMTGGKPDIDTREFTRSNREILYGVSRSLDSVEPFNESVLNLPQPYSNGGHRYLTDQFATTYSRNLPQMIFRKAQHAHAPWHAYMTFCDWGEPALPEERTA